MPCGVQITRLKHIETLGRDVEYLASRDATIMGSRNGHAPLYLWYTLNRKGYRGFQKDVSGRFLSSVSPLPAYDVDRSLSQGLNLLASLSQSLICWQLALPALVF